MSNSKYTREIAKALRSVPKPYPQLFYSVKEYPNMLTVCVYENNIMSFSVDKRVIILEYLNLLRETVKSFGVECELEGLQGDPPTGRGR